ncbi:uncharacterized protein TNCV_3364931 [Trichonephila clavipes]|nr:uncharacterized protein TNCV_3364931 [Trichonephila clavipes]
MDACKCILPSRHWSTINSRRAASPLVSLVEGEESWEAPDPPQVSKWGERAKLYYHLNVLRDVYVVSRSLLRLYEIMIRIISTVKSYFRLDSPKKGEFRTILTGYRGKHRILIETTSRTKQAKAKPEKEIVFVGVCSVDSVPPYVLRKDSILDIKVDLLTRRGQELYGLETEHKLHRCAKIKDEVEKLAYQLNEEAERTERPIRRLSKVMYGSTCADMQVDVMGECLSRIKHVVGVRSVFLAKRLHAV